MYKMNTKRVRTIALICLVVLIVNTLFASLIYYNVGVEVSINLIVIVVMLSLFERSTRHVRA